MSQYEVYQWQFKMYNIVFFFGFVLCLIEVTSAVLFSIPHTCLFSPTIVPVEKWVSYAAYVTQGRS